MSNTALTSETQFATINGKQLAYRKIGNGTPIILANRFRGTLDTWDPLFLDLLAKDHSVITFDYLGIGYSEGELPTDLHQVAGLVNQLADFLHFDKYFVGGWSYGGLIAQYTTFLYPERVLGAIVIGSNPIGRNEIQLSPLFMEKALQPTYTPEDIITLFFEPTSEKSRALGLASLQRIAQRYDEEKVPKDAEILGRYFAATTQLEEDKDNFREAYQTIQIPILAISADNDISFAVENWFPLLKKAPTLQHIIFNGTGHAPHYQYPEQTTAYIKEFIKSSINKN